MSRGNGGLTAALAAIGGGGMSSSPGSSSGAVVEGLEDLLHVLGAMQHKASRTVLRGALRAGLNEIGKGMRREAARSQRRRRKNIPKALGTTVGRDREGLVRAKAGVFVGSAYRRKNNDNWFAHILALGSKPRFRKTKRNAYTGEIREDNFVARGYALAAHAAQGKVTDKARELIDKEILKARR